MESHPFLSFMNYIRGYSLEKSKSYDHTYLRSCNHHPLFYKLLCTWIGLKEFPPTLDLSLSSFYNLMNGLHTYRCNKCSNTIDGTCYKTYSHSPIVIFRSCFHLFCVFTLHLSDFLGTVLMRRGSNP